MLVERTFAKGIDNEGENRLNSSRVWKEPVKRESDIIYDHPCRVGRGSRIFTPHAEKVLLQCNSCDRWTGVIRQSVTNQNNLSEQISIKNL